MKCKFLQAIRIADVKAITACRTITLEAGDLVDLLQVVGFFPEGIKPRTDRTFTPRPFVLLLKQGLPLFQFSSVVLTVGLVFTPCLQNHPEAQGQIILSIERRSDENKRSLKHLLFMQGLDRVHRARQKKDAKDCE